MEIPAPESLAPTAAPAPVEQSVHVDAGAAHVHLVVERPAVVEYLRNIPDSKRAIALVHALEVGITELAARRERFKA